MGWQEIGALWSLLKGQTLASDHGLAWDWPKPPGKETSGKFWMKRFCFILYFYFIFKMEGFIGTSTV